MTERVLPRGLCGHCRRSMTLRADGTLRKHNDPRSSAWSRSFTSSGFTRPVVCLGSNKPPRQDL